MRMRLGLLQDPAVIERQIAREAEKAAEARRKAKDRESSSAPANPANPPKSSFDVPNEQEAKEQAKAHRHDLNEAEEKVRKEEDERKARIKIRPLSEAKAIDSGANFISEAFLFLVAGGLILFESWRGRRKDVKRRDEVKERLDRLEEREQELESLKDKVQRLRVKFADGETQPVSTGLGHDDETPPKKGSETKTDINRTDNKSSRAPQQRKEKTQ